MLRRTTLMYSTFLGTLLGEVTRVLFNKSSARGTSRRSAVQMSPSCVPERYPHDVTPQPADDLLVVTGIARHELFATDASPAAGACVTSITPDLWRSLHRIAEEKGEHVRLDWGSTPPPPTFVCTHSSAAALITPEAWTEPFACRFRASDHINVLELVALVSLIRRLSNQGARRQRILCCVDSRVALGAVTKGRSSSTKLGHVLRKLAYGCLASSLTIDLLWVPSWANPAGAPSRHFSLDRWRRDLPT